MRINKSVALITGANRGIGRAFVDALLERGVSRVHATARDVSTLDAVARLDRTRVHTIKLDVRNASGARAAAAVAKDVNLLINNAAVAGFLIDGSELETPRYSVRCEAHVPRASRQPRRAVSVSTLVSVAPRVGIRFRKQRTERPPCRRCPHGSRTAGQSY